MGNAGGIITARSALMGTDQLPQCVLLVEDHEPTRYGMRHVLTRAGVGRIVEAGTRDEAVAALGDDALPIDCVLLDWLIPGGGADVLLSTRERRPGVGVIVLTVAYERERAA